MKLLVAAALARAPLSLLRIDTCVCICVRNTCTRHCIFACVRNVYLAARLYTGASVRFFALIKGEFVGNAARNNYLYAFLVVRILPSRALARIL